MTREPRLSDRRTLVRFFRKALYVTVQKNQGQIVNKQKSSINTKGSQ